MRYVRLVRLVLHATSLALQTAVTRHSSQPGLQHGFKALSFVLTLTAYVIKSSLKVWGKSLMCWGNIMQVLDQAASRMKSGRTSFRIWPSSMCCTGHMPASACRACFFKLDKLWRAELDHRDLLLSLQGSLRARIILTLTQLHAAFRIRLNADCAKDTYRLVACRDRHSVLLLTCRVTAPAWSVLIRPMNPCVIRHETVSSCQSAEFQTTADHVRSQRLPQLHCDNLLFAVICLSRSCIARASLWAFYENSKVMKANRVRTMIKLSNLATAIGERQSRLRFRLPDCPSRKTQLTTGFSELDVMLFEGSFVEREQSVTGIVSMCATQLCTVNDCKSVAPLYVLHDRELSFPSMFDAAESEAARTPFEMLYSQLRVACPALYSSSLATAALQYRNVLFVPRGTAKVGRGSKRNFSSQLRRPVASTNSPSASYPTVVRTDKLIRLLGSHQMTVTMLYTMIQPVISAQWRHFLQKYLGMVQWQIVDVVLVSPKFVEILMITPSKHLRSDYKRKTVVAG